MTVPARTLLLIDGHALLHRFFYALPPLTTPEREPIGAIYGLCNILLKIIREQKPDYIAACLDRPEPTFRDELFKEYKIQRPEAVDELVAQIVRMREVFEKYSIPVFEKAGFEADDLIGTLAERFRKEDVRVTVLSGDNDLLQLVDDAHHIGVQIIRAGIADAKLYDEAAVKEKFGVVPAQLTDYKGLVGDTSDNIPGIKGVGPKTAVPLINDFGGVEGIFDNLEIIPEKTRKKLEGKKEDALLYKKLATIRRDVPLDPGSLADLKLPPLNPAALAPYFEKFGFQSLVKRLEK